MSDSDGAGFPTKKKTSKAAGKSSKTSGKSDGEDRFSKLRDMGLLAKVNEFAEHQVTLACEVSISWSDGFDDDETDEGNWDVMMLIDPTNVDSIYREYLQHKVSRLDELNAFSEESGAPAPTNYLLSYILGDKYPAIDFTDASIDTYDHGNDGQLHVQVSYPNGLDLSLPTMKEQAAEIASYVCWDLFEKDGPVPPKTIDNRKKNGQTYTDSDSELDFANDVDYNKASRFYGNPDYEEEGVQDEYLYRLKTDDVHNMRWWLENVFESSLVDENGKRLRRGKDEPEESFRRRFRSAGHRRNDDPEHHMPCPNQERVYEFPTTITLIKNTRQPLNKKAVVVATQQVLKIDLKF